MTTAVATVGTTVAPATSEVTDASTIQSNSNAAATSTSTSMADITASAQPITGSPIQQMIQLLQTFMQMFMGMMQTMLGLIAKGSETPGTVTPGRTDPTKPTTPDNQAPELKKLTLTKDAAGQPEIITKDGWQVRFEAKDQAWQIVDPEGKATRIWGDPHVLEADGDTFDFKADSTFMFGNNKATVQTTPAGNGETFSKTVSIYSGNERITITGLDTNKPVVEAAKLDGVEDDAKRKDGDVYRQRDVDRTTGVDKDWLVSEKDSKK